VSARRIATCSRGRDEPKTVEAVVSIVRNVAPEGQVSSPKAVSERVGVRAPVVVPAHALLELQVRVDGAVDGN
jgi:hypothetical protein